MLEAQLTPLFVPQTITYWAGEERSRRSGRGDPAQRLIRMANRRRGWKLSGVSGVMAIPRLPSLHRQHMPMPMNQLPRMNLPSVASPEVPLDPRTNLRVRGLCPTWRTG